MASSRDRLLDAVLEHLAAHGTQDVTLRGLAAAVGTSHRMLSYHFGSRDGLLVAVAQAVEARQRATLAALLSDPEASPLDVMRRMHAAFTDPAVWPQARLFFDLYVRALRGEPAAEPLLRDDVASWLEPVATLFERLGLTPAEARDEARLAIAVARGLLLDLLATGDAAATNRAAERFFAGYGS